MMFVILTMPETAGPKMDRLPVGGPTADHQSTSGLAVVQAILDLRLDLHHLIQSFDDSQFDFFDVASDFFNIHGVSLGFDVQLGTVGAQVGIANCGWNGENTTSADAVVADKEAQLLDGVSIHVQIVSKDDVLGWSTSTLEKEKK